MNKLNNIRKNNKEQNNNQLRPGSLEAATVELGKVPYGESSRKYRRTIYNHNDWIRHRSNDQLFDNLQSMFFSGVVRQVQNKNRPNDLVL